MTATKANVDDIRAISVDFSIDAEIVGNALADDSVGGNARLEIEELIELIGIFMLINFTFEFSRFLLDSTVMLDEDCSVKFNESCDFEFEIKWKIKRKVMKFMTN